MPTRIYVITGKPHREYREPSYTTDLRAYGIKLKAGVTEAEYAEASKGMKAFINRDDAIDFAYHCNLDSVTCLVFDRVGEQWKLNEEETGRLEDDIN